MPLARVLFEPVRSAEPPIISGSVAVSASSVSSEAARVARSFGACASFCLSSLTAGARRSATSPRRRRANSARRCGSSAATRCSQASRAGRLRSPAARHCARMSAGISNGGADQLSLCRAAAISSAPSGAPWLFSVPPLFGAPKPIVVRQAISDGRSESLATSMARAIAVGSWPSIRSAIQPADSKRFT